MTKDSLKDLFPQAYYNFPEYINDRSRSNDPELFHVGEDTETFHVKMKQCVRALSNSNRKNLIEYQQNEGWFINSIRHLLENNMSNHNFLFNIAEIGKSIKSLSSQFIHDSILELLFIVSDEKIWIPPEGIYMKKLQEQSENFCKNIPYDVGSLATSWLPALGTAACVEIELARASQLGLGDSDIEMTSNVVLAAGGCAPVVGPFISVTSLIYNTVNCAGPTAPNSEIRKAKEQDASYKRDVIDPSKILLNCIMEDISNALNSNIADAGTWLYKLVQSLGVEHMRFMFIFYGIIDNTKKLKQFSDFNEQISSLLESRDRFEKDAELIRNEIKKLKTLEDYEREMGDLRTELKALQERFGVVEDVDEYERRTLLTEKRKIYEIERDKIIKKMRRLQEEWMNQKIPDLGGTIRKIESIDETIKDKKRQMIRWISNDFKVNINFNPRPANIDSHLNFLFSGAPMRFTVNEYNYSKEYNKLNTNDYKGPMIRQGY